MRTKFSLCALVALLFAFAGSAALADTSTPPTTGTPPLSSITGGPFDRIDLSNLDVHFSIPVFSRAGVSMPFSYNLSYDSLVWVPVALTKGGTVWLPSANWGWRAQTDAATGYVTNDYTDTTCPLNKQMEIEKWTNFVYHDPNGTSHPFLGAYIEIIDDPGTGCSSHNFTSASAGDGSGYILKPGQAWTGDPSITTTVISSSGLTIIPPTSNATSGNGSITDPNNNRITVGVNGSTTTLTDTLNTTALTITGTPPSPVSYTYSAPSGQAAVKVSYVQYWVQTCFQVSGISEYPATAANLVDTITLPDGSHYHFTYETTVGCGASGKTTGRIASVTLPTGGVINYSYAGSGCGNNSNCMMADGSPAHMTRSLGGGTWTYTRRLNPNGNSNPQFTQTTLVNPANNETDYNFNGTYETLRSTYQGLANGGTLLDTKWTGYNGCWGGCDTTALSLPITSKHYNDTLGGFGANHLWFDYNYNSYGLVWYETDRDFGNVGPILRTITTNYNTALCTSKNICNHLASVQIVDGGSNQKSLTNYSYDGNGNTTEVSQWTSWSTPYLNQYYTYNANGTIATAKNPNGTLTTYSYAGNSCNGAFPSSVTVPSQFVGSLTTSYGYNCTGGVRTTMTDPNGATTSASYTDRYYWRPASSTDPLGNTTYYNYYGVTNNPGGSAISLVGQAESVLSWTSSQGNSTIDSLSTVDGYGRPILQQKRQGPGSGNWDSVGTAYNAANQVQWVSSPYTGTIAGQYQGPQPAEYWSYDGLGRVVDEKNYYYAIDIHHTYNANDVLVTTNPAPSGENPKSHQYEYDALGRLTSVCELSNSLAGVGGCGQNNNPGSNGYRTLYGYDPLGNQTAVNQSGQIRSFTYDGLSRLLTESNPENGITSYTYDTDSTCGAHAGDKVKRIDAASNVTCYVWDGLHRLTNVNYVSGPNQATSTNKEYQYDGSTPDGYFTVSNPRGRLVESHTSNSGGWVVTELFGYTARGEPSDAWYWIPDGGSWYHTVNSYAPNGVAWVRFGYLGTGTSTPFTNGLGYVVDGEGRLSGLWDGNIGHAVWAGTTFNAASQPDRVALYSGDSETFTWDQTTGHMTQWKSTIGSQTQTGNLNWNVNGTLYQMAITDTANSSNTQTCTNTYDDLARLSQNFCSGSPGWTQSFSYDAFGNIKKTGSSSFTPTYNSNNRVTSFSYDGMGNVTNDGVNTYSYDPEGRPFKVNGARVFVDAFNHTVEVQASSGWREYAYSPDGYRLGIMNGQSVVQVSAPLAEGMKAVYGPYSGGKSQILFWRHSDWLGTERLASTPSRTVYYDGAYAPFGENYVETGTKDRSYTDQTQDSASGDYDFPMRQQNANQGRWLVPDPAGLGAVDITNPQTWNRYAYVGNNPLSNVDPQGLCGEDNNSPSTGQVLKGVGQIVLGVTLIGACGEAGPLVWIAGGSLVEAGILNSFGGSTGNKSATELADLVNNAGNPGTAILMPFTDNENALATGGLIADILSLGLSGEPPTLPDSFATAVDAEDWLDSVLNPQSNGSSQLPRPWPPAGVICSPTNPCKFRGPPLVYSPASGGGGGGGGSAGTSSGTGGIWNFFPTYTITPGIDGGIDGATYTITGGSYQFFPSAGSHPGPHLPP